MYMYVHIYMYVHVYICVYVCVRVCIYKSVLVCSPPTSLLHSISKAALQGKLIMPTSQMKKLRLLKFNCLLPGQYSNLGLLIPATSADFRMSSSTIWSDLDRALHLADLNFHIYKMVPS